MSDLVNLNGMAGGRFKVAAVQMDLAPGLETNLAHADALVGEVAAQGAKLRCG